MLYFCYNSLSDFITFLHLMPYYGFHWKAKGRLWNNIVPDGAIEMMGDMVPRGSTFGNLYRFGRIQRFLLLPFMPG